MYEFIIYIMYIYIGLHDNQRNRIFHGVKVVPNYRIFLFIYSRICTFYIQLKLFDFFLLIIDQDFFSFIYI